MTKYLISFNDGAIDHIADEDWPDVGKASPAVVQEAMNAGVRVSCRRAPEVREIMPDAEQDEWLGKHK